MTISRYGNGLVFEMDFVLLRVLKVKTVFADNAK